ncbi:hypothetical protein RCO27_13980 [Sphingosinicella sp. LHD-64]|uniref:hypothetical protein n=1 Tax=Sphingosinicella sp. LHD-64 TaxID=3072139 RepID=UPI00280ECD16|nr:hypothetical protein [Sphingosinicella sp. LHD-64]MDQ8757335.1 hypothetical protein [Sphingosinicella sp. LHD-64]
MRIALFLPLLLLAGCETTQQPYAPVDNVRYSAVGEEPFWLLNIGDDRIVLRMADAGQDAVWPRTLPRTVDGVRTWQSGDGTGVITVEARPGPCINARERRFEDRVTVRLSGHGLIGCGGRLLGERN